MFDEMLENKKRLYWIIGGLAVVLVAVAVAAMLIGGGKGGKVDVLPSQSTAAAESTGATDPTGTTGPQKADPTDPTGATGGKTETPGKTDDKKNPTATTAPTDPVEVATDPVATEPEPTEASEPDSQEPVQTKPTEPTEPKEPTIGVDTETTPPQADNVIDFDDLLNAGKNNG